MASFIAPINTPAEGQDQSFQSVVIESGWARLWPDGSPVIIQLEEGMAFHQIQGDTKARRENCN